MKFCLKLVLLLIFLNGIIQKSSSLEIKDASSNSRQFTENPAYTFTPVTTSLNISTSGLRWSVSSSKSSPAASALLTDSKFSASTSVSPLSTSKVFTSTSFLTSTSPKTPIFQSFVSSTESLVFTPNVSSVRESDFRVNFSLKIPPCLYDDEGNEIRTEEIDYCSEDNATFDITCYTNNRTLSICLEDEPINAFASNDQFYSYASNAADSYLDGGLDICSITAEFLHNLPTTHNQYTQMPSGLRFAFIYDEVQIHICLPIFLYLGNCTSNDAITTCIEKDLTVIFFPGGCKLPVLPNFVIEKALARLGNRSKFVEIKKICNGYLLSFEQNNEGTSLNTSSVEESDFEIDDLIVIPPCRYDNETDSESSDEDVFCNEGNTTMYISCYNNGTFHICLKEKPINSFVSNDQFLIYASNAANSHPSGNLDVCLLTAQLLYNLPLTFRWYEPTPSGVRMRLITNEDITEICLPIFLYLGNCTSNDVIITCVEKDLTVIFFHGGCRLPVLPDSVITKALARLVILNKFDEIKKICNGYLESFVQNIEGTSLNTSNVEESDFEIFELFILPPCRHDNESDSESTDNYSGCLEGNTTTYISCYSNGTLCICLEEMPINSFASNDQFLSYVRNTSAYQSNEVSSFCELTAPVHGILMTFLSAEYVGNDKTYLLAKEKEAIKICLPIMEYLGNCTNNEEIITCNLNKNVVIFVPGGCMLPSGLETIFHKILITNFLEHFFTRVKEICHGKFSYSLEVIKGINVILIPPHESSSYPSVEYGSLNRYWPCCYKKYFVIWMEDPKTVGLSQHWSYLPVECQVGEIFLLTFQGVATMFGLIGNFIVLAVMFNGGHHGEASSFFRTSLCLSDFIMSAFVMAPATYDNMAIINGNLVYTFFSQTLDSADPSLLNRNPLVSNFHIDVDFIDTETNSFKRFYVFNEEANDNITATLKLYDEETYYPFFTYFNGWFQVIRGKLLCICSCVTMIMMFCLGAERLVLCWCPLKYKTLFLMYRVKRAIFLAWAFGLISSIVISYGDSFTVYWNTWTKLSFGFRNTNLFYNLAVKVVSIILCVLGSFTFIFSVLALVAFRREIKRIRKERESLDMRITDDFEKENLYITISLILMTVLYLIAYLPVGINVLSEHEQFMLTKYPLFMFFSWWLLLAGSAWNPFVYNFRSHIFRSELAELLEKFLPQSQKDRMKPYITHPRHPMKRYLKELDKKAAKTGESHDGLPKGSKLARLGFGFDNRSHNTGENEGNVGESAF